MGQRVQKWADVHFGWAALAVVVFAASVLAGGIVWMNEAEATVAVQPEAGPAVVVEAVHPSFTCAHKTQLTMIHQGPSFNYDVQNRITAYWNTVGATCQVGSTGSSVNITSANYWCSWLGGDGYYGTCSAWRSATHAEVDAKNCWADGCWWTQVSFDVDRYGRISYRCLVTQWQTEQAHHDALTDHCQLVKLY